MNGNALTAGTPAPMFVLPASPDRRISLEEFRGRPVVLAFYPADWSPVCGDQMTLYSALRSEWDRLGVEVLGRWRSSPRGSPGRPPSGAGPAPGMKPRCWRR